MTTNSTFIFQGWEIQGKEILFHFVLKKGEGEYNFTEKLLLSSKIALNTIPYDLLESTLNNLLLVLGVSYWKLYCCEDIRIVPFVLSYEQAEFWNTVYTKGLGEFFYKNKIDFHGLVHFPFVEDAKTVSIKYPRQERSLLLIGGGKDSIVSGELLIKAGKAFSAFIVNEHAIQTATVKLLGVEKIIFKRILDPLLFELNKQKETYNGHVPVSAQYAFLSILAAILYDFRYIIASNEQSANYGNVLYLGEEINHQWSKSEEFEHLFQEYVKSYMTPSVDYFSLLRPLSEIAITKIFSQYEKYFSVFSSCNRNFRIAGEGNSKRWCGECPKCLFVFSMLSAFLPREKLLAIFEKNIFQDVRILPLCKELLGIGDIKPFECVGTPEEVRLALYLAWEKEEWKDTPVMELFTKEVLPHMQNNEEQKEQLFGTKEHVVPEGFEEIIRV